MDLNYMHPAENGDKTNNLYRVKLRDGDTLMRVIKDEGGEIVMKAEDGDGFITVDWMEFADQMALGRILPEAL